MGIKFLGLQPEPQKRIEEHIKSHKNRNLWFKNWNTPIME
jgi:hypothetical protein